MKTVWKFPIEKPAAIVKIEMPETSQILTVQVQNNIPCLWALIEPENKVEIRNFRIVGTGHEITERIRTYIGSFQLENGYLVFHVFELAGNLK